MCAMPKVVVVYFIFGQMQVSFELLHTCIYLSMALMLLSVMKRKFQFKRVNLGKIQLKFVEKEEKNLF